MVGDWPYDIGGDLVNAPNQPTTQALDSAAGERSLWRSALKRGFRIAAAGAMALILALTGESVATAADAGYGKATGRVLDEYGKPVNKLTVTEMGEYRETQTNSKGYFTITVPAGQKTTLRFTDWKYFVFPTRYLGGTSTESNARRFTVAAGQSANLGTIRLRVTAKPTRSATAVNTKSKSAVKKAYLAYRKHALVNPRVRYPRGCTPPTTPYKSQKRTILAVNYMRSMAGLDKVTLNTTFSRRAKQSSLIQYYQGYLSHTPGKGAKCYTSTGRQAASRSNLASGSIASQAVRGYMIDPGSHNTEAGHRRWILNPDSKQMGTADVGMYNSLYVIGPESSNRARPRWITWPTSGWFPAQEEPEGRWSFSSVRSDVSFAKARIKVRTSSGKVLKVKKYKPANGYGPNTVVFQVSGLPKVKGKGVVRVRVTISGITQRGITQPTISYPVRMFNPLK